MNEMMIRLERDGSGRTQRRFALPHDECPAIAEPPAAAETRWRFLRLAAIRAG